MVSGNAAMQRTIINAIFAIWPALSATLLA
jgi:hypothetical protein